MQFNFGNYGAYLKDTLINLVTGLGTQKDPRTSSHFHLRVLDRNVLETAYRSDWMARRLVDLPAEDATREWRTWQGKPKLVKAIAELEADQQFQIQRKMQEALIRGRLYGGGALVLGVDQGEPDEELDIERVGKGDLKFVVVLNRYELNAGPRIYNVDSPWYTRPQYYSVATPMFGFFGEQGGAFPQNTTTPPNSPPNGKLAKPGMLSDPNMQVQGSYGMVMIHPSRVIEFTGNPLPDWRLAPMGGGWGDSILQTVDDTLRDFSMIIGGLASIVNDMKMDVVQVPELSKKLANDDLSAKLLKRWSVANMSKSTINTLLIDVEEKWQRITTSFGSTPDLVKVAMQLACAAGGVPETRIMGNAPSNALGKDGSGGGEVDLHSYFDDINSQQRSKYRPMMTPLDRCIVASALGGYDGEEYIWNPLYKENPLEVAQIGLAKAQTTQIYINMGLFNEDMMRDATISQLEQDKLYPGLEDAINEHGTEPEEPPPPLMPAPPTPPPGMMAKGAFDPNPFHLLRAQAAAKSGLPIKVPPNRPPGAPKFLPAPPGAQGFGAKDAFDLKEERDEHGRWTAGAAEAVLRSGGHVTNIGQLSPEAVRHLGKLVAQGHATKGEDFGYPGRPHARYEPAPHFVSDEDIEDFNPYHDPDSGRFTSSEGTAAARAKAQATARRSEAAKTAYARRARQAESQKRSQAARQAHASRQRRLAEAFPVRANPTDRDAGMTAVARVMAAQKLKGKQPTKGEISIAAKQDVKTAVEAYAETMHLPEPKVPEGVDPKDFSTAYHWGVVARRLWTDPATRNIIFGKAVKNTSSWAQTAVQNLPEHAMHIVHKTVVEKIADVFHEGLTDLLLGSVVAAATAAGGPLGGGVATLATPFLHSEVEHVVEKTADAVGFTPEFIKHSLNGVGHELLDHYRKVRRVYEHSAEAAERVAAGAVQRAGSWLPDEDPEYDPLGGYDPIEATLEALSDVIDTDPDDGDESFDGYDDVIDFDPSEPRDPHGEWTSGSYGLVAGDVEKFHGLKDQWAKVNNHLLNFVDKPDSPEAKADMAELERISKEIHGLHADPGTPEGIGLPGGPRDVTIIGAGPGGLAASIFGGAEGLDTLLVESNAVAGGQARYSSRIENFPGFPVGVTGETLTKNMFEQAERLGADEELGVRVTGLEYDEKTGLKRLSLSDGTKVVSRTVILAGGVEFRKPTFPGAEGSGVIVGDGKALTAQAEGGNAVVLGGSNGAAQAALGAATKASHVYLISRSQISKGMSDYQVEAVHNQPKITVIENDNVAKLNRSASGDIESIETTKGQKLSAKALGVFLGSVPETNWLAGEVTRDAAGRVETDAKLETKIPGVFAVGDMREGAIGRIGVAVGEGQLALREANVYLEGMRKPKKTGVATDAAPSVYDGTWLISQLFALDRDNPYLGATVEGVKPGRKK